MALRWVTTMPGVMEGPFLVWIGARCRAFPARPRRVGIFILGPSRRCKRRSGGWQSWDRGCGVFFRVATKPRVLKNADSGTKPCIPNAPKARWDLGPVTPL